jgi:hypothetical protein
MEIQKSGMFAESITVAGKLLRPPAEDFKSELAGFLFSLFAYIPNTELKQYLPDTLARKA